MTAISKRNYRRCVLYLTLLSLLAFLIFYIPNLYFGEIDAVLYISYFAKELINFVLPLVAAVAVTLAALDNTKGRAMLYSLSFAVVPLPYTIPYYYYDFVTDYYNSAEAILLALLMSVLLVLAFSVEVFVYHLIIKAVMKKNDPTPLINTPVKDLDAPATLGVFYAVLLKYLYKTAFELYNVVTYLIEYSGNYRAGEIIYITVTLVLLIAFGFIAHITACNVKNKLTTLN